MVLWVFGYGSLIWNPGFEFDEKVVGFIKGYKRVFDLGTVYHPLVMCSVCLYRKFFHISSLMITKFYFGHGEAKRVYAWWWFLLFFSACFDHRGTPDKPARTCTLEESEEAICVSEMQISSHNILLFLTRNLTYWF